MEHLFTSESIISFFILVVLEVVLGIDNVIFLSVIVSRIPPRQAKRARQIGLALAVIFRIALLTVLVWLIGLTEPVLTVQDFAFSWRDIILVGGGLFLIAKATHEIHGEVEVREHEVREAPKPRAFFWVIVQIIIIDLVFSLDSIITAIGNRLKPRNRFTRTGCNTLKGTKVSTISAAMANADAGGDGRSRNR